MGGDGATGGSREGGKKHEEGGSYYHGLHHGHGRVHVLGNRTRPPGQGPLHHTSSPYLRSADYDTALAGEDDECAQGEVKKQWK